MFQSSFIRQMPLYGIPCSGTNGGQARLPENLFSPALRPPAGRAGDSVQRSGQARLPENLFGGQAGELGNEGNDIYFDSRSSGVALAISSAGVQTNVDAWVPG